MPSSHRSLRIAEAIREVVSSAILFEVSDPRVKGVTVITVEVPGDLRSAVVYVSIMGTQAEQDEAMRGIRSATGFLQSLVAARLQTRSTPVLSFKRDDGVKRSVEMSRIIEETLEADRRKNAEVQLGPMDDSDDDDEEDDEFDESEEDVDDDDASLDEPMPPSR